MTILEVRASRASIGSLGRWFVEVKAEDARGSGKNSETRRDELSHPFLTATSSFENGPQVSTTPGWRSFIIERGHRGHEPREGDLEYHASQGRFRLRQRRPHNNQSGSPPRPPW